MLAPLSPSSFHSGKLVDVGCILAEEVKLAFLKDRYQVTSCQDVLHIDADEAWGPVQNELGCLVILSQVELGICKCKGVIHVSLNVT